MSEVSEAIQAERERCAVLLEEMAEECRKHLGSPFSRSADVRLDDAAAIIRGDEESRRKFFADPEDASVMIRRLRQV